MESYRMPLDERCGSRVCAVLLPVGGRQSAVCGSGSVSRLCAALMLAGIGLLAAGCEPAAAPQFEPVEATTRLIPEVAEGMTITTEEGETLELPGINSMVREKFGTLSAPKVWPILPIEFGGTSAVVTKVVSPTEEEADAAQDAETPIEQLSLVVAAAEGAAFSAMPAGAMAGWTDGEYEGRLSRVVSFDPMTGKLILAGTFDDGLPDVEDEMLLDPGETLAKGQGLYNRHCMHCHGAGGAGDGPTARYLQPVPRDFRLGIFKYTSTGQSDKVSRADMLDTLRDGIPGTSMPSFRMLAEDELHAIGEYVRWLSMRGEYENLLAVTAAGAYEFTKEVYQERIADGDTREEILEEVAEYLRYDLPEDPAGEDIADSWSDANEDSAIVYPEVPRVADTPASRARGRELYLSKRMECVTCHGPYGKGDGSKTVVFTESLRTGEPNPTPGLYDVWGNPIEPRDLTRGIYHGGRRPIDLYRRLHSRIKGTPMPSFGGALTDQEIWDLVNFILHLPHEELPEPGSGEAVVSAGH